MRSRQTVAAALVAVVDRRLPHGAVEKLDRHREYDGRVLFGRDGAQRLKVAQLQRQRRLADDVGRLFQRPRRLLLALRRDHLLVVNHSQSISQSSKKSVSQSVDEIISH